MSTYSIEKRASENYEWEVMKRRKAYIDFVKRDILEVNKRRREEGYILDERELAYESKVIEYMEIILSIILLKEEQETTEASCASFSFSSMEL